MGRGIQQPLALVVAHADHAARQRHDHRAHRHLVLVRRLGCFLQRHPHVGFVKRMAWIGPRKRSQAFCVAEFEKIHWRLSYYCFHDFFARRENI